MMSTVAVGAEVSFTLTVADFSLKTSPHLRKCKDRGGGWRVDGRCVSEVDVHHLDELW